MSKRKHLEKCNGCEELYEETFRCECCDERYCEECLNGYGVCKECEKE